MPSFIAIGWWQVVARVQLHAWCVSWKCFKSKRISNNASFRKIFKKLENPRNPPWLLMWRTCMSSFIAIGWWEVGARVQLWAEKFPKSKQISKKSSFSKNIWKFENPRNPPLGIDVENMHAKFGLPPTIGSWSKIGGTEASGEQQQEQQELILHAKIADFKQSPKPNQTEFRHGGFGIVIIMAWSVHIRGFKSFEHHLVVFWDLRKCATLWLLYIATRLAQRLSFFGGAAPASAVAGCFK